MCNNRPTQLRSKLKKWGITKTSRRRRRRVGDEEGQVSLTDNIHIEKSLQAIVSPSSVPTPHEETRSSYVSDDLSFRKPGDEDLISNEGRPQSATEVEAYRRRDLVGAASNIPRMALSSEKYQTSINHFHHNTALDNKMDNRHHHVDFPVPGDGSAHNHSLSIMSDANAFPMAHSPLLSTEYRSPFATHSASSPPLPSNFAMPWSPALSQASMPQLQIQPRSAPNPSLWDFPERTIVEASPPDHTGSQTAREKYGISQSAPLSYTGSAPLVSRTWISGSDTHSMQCRSAAGASQRAALEGPGLARMQRPLQVRRRSPEPMQAKAHQGSEHVHMLEQGHLQISGQEDLLSTIAYPQWEGILPRPYRNQHF